MMHRQGCSQKMIADTTGKNKSVISRELDTIVGEDNKGATVTMVERKTAFMMMEILKHGKNAKNFSKTVVKMPIAYILMSIQ